jgi:hypothetical protein
LGRALYRAAELAQFVPDLVALARTVTVEPVRRRHADILPHLAAKLNVRRTGWLPADAMCPG